MKRALRMWKVFMLLSIRWDTMFARFPVFHLCDMVTSDDLLPQPRTLYWNWNWNFMCPTISNFFTSNVHYPLTTTKPWHIYPCNESVHIPSACEKYPCYFLHYISFWRFLVFDLWWPYVFHFHQDHQGVLYSLSCIHILSMRNILLSFLKSRACKIFSIRVWWPPVTFDFHPNSRVLERVCYIAFQLWEIFMILTLGLMFTMLSWSDLWWYMTSTRINSVVFFNMPHPHT